MSVNLRFSFKMDLADISTIDFAFAETYVDLETNPFLEKSYPEVGTLQNKAIVIPLSDEEAEELPTQFYALATVNFKNGSTVKAHAFKNTAKEEALSAILMTDNTEYNIDFFIDETNGGGGSDISVEPNGHLDLSNGVLSTEANKIYQPVFNQDGSISYDIANYPNIKFGDIAVHSYQTLYPKIWVQGQYPDTTMVYWSELYLNKVKTFIEDTNPPAEIGGGASNYPIGSLWQNTTTNTWFILTDLNQPSPGSIFNTTWTVLATETETEHKIFNAVYDINDEISNAFSDYPGIKIGDFIMDTTNFSQYGQAPKMIYSVTLGTDPSGAHFIAEPVAINQRYCDGTPPVQTNNINPYSVGDIIYSTNKKIYKCISAISSSVSGFTDYEWQEVTFIPKPTAADAGKVLKVNAEGEPEWVTE